jgi:hypothetical protein
MKTKNTSRHPGSPLTAMARVMAIGASLAAGLAPALRADHTEFVVIKAAASKDYIQQKIVNGAVKPETYVFLQGKYFEGDTRDASIDDATFMDIAKVLAPDLAKQAFFPTRDAKSANLLIAVSWGRTLTDQIGQKSDLESNLESTNERTDLNSYSSGMATYMSGKGGATAMPPDPAGLTMDLGTDQTNAMSAQKFAEFNATLLGYTGAFQKETQSQWASANGLNSAAESQLTDLNDSRYFVILMAYDYQAMRRNAAANGAAPPPKPLWTVRINMRSTGNNFTQGLPAMSQAAADYFGKQFDDLKVAQVVFANSARH